MYKIVHDLPQQSSQSKIKSNYRNNIIVSNCELIADHRILTYLVIGKARHNSKIIKLSKNTVLNSYAILDKKCIKFLYSFVIQIN